MRYVIIPADVPNRNKRIYPRETLVKALEKIPTVVYGYLSGDFPATGTAAFTATEFAMDSGGLTAEITPLTTPAGKVLVSCLDHLSFAPVGEGMVAVGEDEIATVTSYTLHSVCAVLIGDDKLTVRLVTRAPLTAEIAQLVEQGA